MGQARELMDRATQAFLAKDQVAIAACYADDAVITTPDQGELKGGHELAGYMLAMFEGFPDATYEPINTLECGDTAVDEGWFVGTNTAPITTPDGTQLPATGARVRVRGCDVATVENGVIVSHRMYWDQTEFASQLGLAPQ